MMNGTDEKSVDEDASKSHRTAVSMLCVVDWKWC